jgi:hypothetical protein
VTLLALSASIASDFNRDGTVDSADFVAWRKGLGTIYTQNDYDVWRAHFGQTTGSSAAIPVAEPLSAQVPEASALSIALVFAFGLVACCRPTNSRLRR